MNGLEYEFYIDVFFLTSFYLNALALGLTALMGNRRIRIARICLAAALGSAANCLFVVFPVLPVGGELLAAAVFLGSGMTAAAFSLKSPKQILLADGQLLLASVLMGGGLQFFRQFFYLNDWQALFCLTGVSAAAGVFLRKLWRERGRARKRYPVCLYYKGKKKEFLALADSGNRLREPTGGKPVSVIAASDCKGFCDSVQAVLFVPFRSVGTEHGLLPALIFECMEISLGEETVVVERPVVAVARERLSSSGDFSMLLPEELLFGHLGVKFRNLKGE